jgi:hypothetical protein
MVDHSEILRAIGDLKQDVGRVEGKMDAFTSQHEECKDERISISKRLGAVEKKQARHVGIFVGFVAAVTGAVEFLRNL